MESQLLQERTIPAGCTTQTTPGNQVSFPTTLGNQLSYLTTPGNQSTYPTTPGNQSTYPTTPGNQQLLPGPCCLPSPTPSFPEQHCNSAYSYPPPSNQVPYPVPPGTPTPPLPYHDQYQPYSPGANNLINANGSPNTSFIYGEQKCQGDFKITLNCKNDDDDNRKSRPFRCIKEERGTMVMMTPSKKSGDKIINGDKVFSVWTKSELPKDSQFRWLVLRKDKQEAHKPVYMCPTHGEDGWGEWVRKMAYFCSMPTKQESKSAEPFIISGQIGYYELKEEHYMLVVPVSSLRMSRGTNVHTGEEGFIYSGSFYFPCNTKDLKSKENCVTLVVSLEGPGIEPEVLTFDLRVCACPGRDGDKMVDNGKNTKKSRKRGANKKDSSAPKQPKVTSSNIATIGSGFHDEMVAESSLMGPQSSFVDSFLSASEVDTTTDDIVTTMRCSTRRGSSKQNKILQMIGEMRKQFEKQLDKLDELERMVLESNDEGDSDGE